jgi:hypothetical protein
LQDNKEQLKNSAAKVDPTDYLKLQRRSLQKKARYSQNSKDQAKTAGELMQNLMLRTIHPQIYFLGLKQNYVFLLSLLTFELSLI